MRLKNLYDDSGLRVVVLDRENPAQIKKCAHQQYT